MISVAHLTRKYDQLVALDDVSFEVGRGEVVGILGPNGAGKSTLMRILSGYLPASGGRVRVGGYDVFTQSLEVRRRIGYLPESTPLYPEMRVDEYLRFRARLKGLPARRHRTMLSEVKERCGLQAMGRAMIGRLSHGYRQRVGLADALVHDPDVLLLDEPMLGMDPAQNRHVRDMISDLAEKHTVLLSSHMLAEVESMCSRVLVLKRGRIVAANTPDHLREEMRQSTRLLAQIRGKGTEVLAALVALPHVQQAQWVREDGAWGVYRVESAREVDLRPTVFEAVVRNGWGLRDLHLETPPLESVYLDILQRADGEGSLP